MAFYGLTREQIIVKLIKKFRTYDDYNLGLAYNEITDDDAEGLSKPKMMKEIVREMKDMDYTKLKRLYESVTHEHLVKHVPLQNRYGYIDTDPHRQHKSFWSLGMSDIEKSDSWGGFD